MYIFLSVGLLCCAESDRWLMLAERQILLTATDKKNPLRKEVQNPAALKQLQERVRRRVKCWRKSSKSSLGFEL